MASVLFDSCEGREKARMTAELDRKRTTETSGLLARVPKAWWLHAAFFDSLRQVFVVCYPPTSPGLCWLLSNCRSIAASWAWPRSTLERAEISYTAHVLGELLSSDLGEIKRPVWPSLKILTIVFVGGLSTLFFLSSSTCKQWIKRQEINKNK